MNPNTNRAVLKWLAALAALGLCASGCSQTTKGSADSGAAVHGSASANASDAQAPAPDTTGKVTTIKFVRDPQPAPDFQLPGIDGKPVSLSASRGKVTLISFWATWCGPCKIEIPSLIDLQSKYGAQLQVIGIGNDDVPLADVKKYAANMKMNYPIAITSDDLEKKFGGVAALPTTFLIDTQGRIVQKHVGVWDEDAFETEIRSLAGLPVNAKVETFEDTGQIFLANVSKATELPDVDMSKLTPEQKKVALRRMNEEGCTCGCMLTVAECRINDESCDISMKRAAEIVQEVAKGAPPKSPAPPPAAPSPRASLESTP